jgi:recombination protein RecT
LRNLPQNYQQNDVARIASRLKAEINISDYHDAYTIDTAMQAVAIIFSENNNFQRCTPESKYKAVLSMVCQGLNPLKGQCSFVPYGDQLQLLRDYSGSIMVAKREDKRIAAINSKVVRDGDNFEFEIVNGCYKITKHRPTIQSLNSDIIAAYAVAVDQSGQVIDADIMTIEDIKKTWRNRQLKYKGEPVVRQDGTIHPGSNHGKYPEKMTAKTVVHRLCRSIIKSSGNESIAAAAEHDEEFVIIEDMPEQLPTTEPKVLDFDAVEEKVQAPEPIQNQATREQAAKIIAQAREIGREIELFHDISEFCGRKIEKIREMTMEEAHRFFEKMIQESVQVDEDVPWKK